MWKDVSLRLILRDKGGNQDCLSSKNKGLTEKKGGVWEVVVPGRRANDIPWEGRVGLPEGPRVGGIYTD